VAGFNVNDFAPSTADRYERRIKRLQAEGFYTDSIESTVRSALENIEGDNAQSFVIYGEPQSGKTEMMIALTSRLLDAGRRIIVVLMNDSVQLLEQNLDRFLRSGLDPAPKKFNEVLDPSIDLENGTWVIFCKKNSADLQKLLAKLEGTRGRIVIDDEADFASPNAKINQHEKTRINELVETMIGDDGIYIGVTATPARLDLNNTFNNESEHWIDFPTHPKYTGQSTFFPTSKAGFQLPFALELLPPTGDDPKYLRDAFFSFLINVAHLNLQINDPAENYCMLVHTSGKKVDHTKDYQQIITLLSDLKDVNNPKRAKHLEAIYTQAQVRYPGHEREITQYVVDHINQSDVVIMNSDTPRNAALYRRATSPAALFTVAIGGNIVSRGVTFDNLLSMFFTRDVKHKIQQDTYIQRARMFGTRGGYLKYFELHIPEQLYFDWQKCFVFHQLALSFIKAGKGSPIWLEDRRIAAVAGSSIDQAAVALDSGEMSWEIFEYDPAIDQLIDSGKDPFTTLKELAAIVGDNALPEHVLAFIDSFNLGKSSIAVHSTTTLGKSYGTEEERAEIRRRRGFIGTNQMERTRFPHAIHHIKVFRNDSNRARVFYKYTPEMGSIRFLKNVRGEKP
jgi:Z1 domain/Type III restriction enzyme, res subunit